MKTLIKLPIGGIKQRNTEMKMLQMQLMKL